jgi:negative regulator of flagellin synthesis FlgM
VKIDNSIKSLTSGTIADEPQRPAKKAASDAAGSPLSTNVKISALSAHMQAIEQGFAATPIVNSARVAELKQAISDGHFKVDAEKVADRLLSTVRDLILAHKA